MLKLLLHLNSFSDLSCDNRGGRGDAHQEPSAINHGNLNSSSTNNNHNSVGQRGGGGGAGGISAGDGSTKLMSRDDELLLARHRQTAGGLHANANAGGARGHDDAYLHHRHSAAGSRGGGGGAGVGVGARSGAAAAAAAAAGISRGGMSARSHLYQMQQQVLIFSQCTLAVGGTNRLM